MFAWIKYVALLPALYQLIKGAVEICEDVAEDGVLGTEKKAAVLDAVKAGCAALGFSAVWSILEPVASAMIDITVAIYNAVGGWKKKEAPAPPVAPAEPGPSTDSVVDGVVADPT